MGVKQEASTPSTVPHTRLTLVSEWIEDELDDCSSAIFPSCMEPSTGNASKGIPRQPKGKAQTDGCPSDRGAVVVDVVRQLLF